MSSRSKQAKSSAKHHRSANSADTRPNAQTAALQGRRGRFFKRTALAIVIIMAFGLVMGQYTRRATRRNPMETVRVNHLPAPSSQSSSGIH